MLSFTLGFILGNFIGITIMCMLQINRLNNKN